MDDFEADMQNLYDRECRVLPDWALSDVDLDHRAALAHRSTIDPGLSLAQPDPQPESEVTL